MIKEASAVDLSEKDRRHHLHPLTNPVALLEKGPDMVTHAEGVYLYMSDGRRVMDTGSGLWNVSLGYGNPRLCEVAAKVMRELSFGHTIFGRSNPWAAAFSEKMTEITPDQYQHFFFAATGSEAIETSIKMALHYWRLRGRREKRKFIGRRRSYHGNTLFTAGLTGIEMFHTQFGLPLGDMIQHADSTHWYQEGNGRSKEEFCRDLIRGLEDQIREIGPENIAAFVVEAIQSSGGMIMPPEGYWPQVRQICDRYDILMIADEVVAGFGKTGRMFGFENFGFEPDLFAMAKGISSGYFPVSAVAVGKKVGDVIQSANEIFAHVFTNCGHPVGAATALETLAIIEEEGLLQRVSEEIGPYFHKRLNELLDLPCVGEVRSLGVMGGFDVDASGGARSASSADNDALLDRIVSIAWKRGMIVRGGGICLPMIITKAQIDEAISMLRESIVEAWGGKAMSQRTVA